MNIAIIGAGIGGLTTAILLKKMGFDVQIYEQADELKPIGAGIMLAHNAMQVYDKLGLKNQISDLGNTLTSLNITGPNLRLISSIKNQSFDEKFSVNHIAIHRGALQNLLINQLPSNCINLHKNLIDIKQHEKISLIFSDNSEHKYDVVIAADGIHSFVRKSLFPDSVIRDAKQVCWRGIANMELPSRYMNELNEAWGSGTRFGFVQISKQQVYWYALCNNNKVYKGNNPLTLFNDYHPTIQTIVANTSESSFIQNDIKDLKPLSTWYQRNICLIGDAAHATTPNMGQGACQAIEDAYVLSQVIKKYPINIAFKKYQLARIKKAKNIVNMSWNIGKVSHIENYALVFIRNFLMNKMPTKLKNKELEKVLTL